MKKSFLVWLLLLSNLALGDSMGGGGSGGGGGGGGGITSINADTTAGASIVGSNGISVSNDSAGTNTVNGTLLAPKDSPAFTTQATFSYGTASTVPYFDSSKKLISSSVTPTTLGYLDATSSIQTQLNGKQSSLTFAQSVSNSAGTVTLSGDSATPGNSKYYGTDNGGTKGYFSLPAGGSPAGSTTYVQYNSSGSFGANSGFTSDGSGNVGVNTLTSAGVVKAGSGAVGGPSYSYGSDTNTGEYLAGTHQIGFASNGIEMGTLDTSNGITMFANNSTAYGEHWRPQLGAYSMHQMFGAATDFWVQALGSSTVNFDLANSSTASVFTITQDNSAVTFSDSNTTALKINQTVTIGTASTTPQHAINTATATSASCGSLSGGAACIQITVNGTTHYIPYF